MKTLALLLTLPFLTPAQNDDLRQLAAEARSKSKHVYARIDGLSVTESALQVNVHGNKSGSRFYFNGWSGPTRSFNVSGDLNGLWGGDVNLSLSKSGDSLYVNGWIDGKPANFSLSKWGDNWNLNGLIGSSLSLYRSGNSFILSGYLEEGRGSPSPGKLVSVIGAVIAMATAK